MEKEWRWQEAWERRREVNRERVIIERKCFVCGGFGHITCNCKNMKNRQEEELTQRSLNKFEVLKDRVMNIGEGSKREMRKDRKMVLREEKAKREKSVEV